MGRSRTYARGIARHQKSNDVYASTEHFLDALEKASSEIIWCGSRESDTLRLEALHNGMIIRLLHMLPRDHRDYIDCRNFVSGKYREEILIEIRDLNRETGLTNLFKDHFDNTSALFGRAKKVFATASQGITFTFNGERETLPYSQTISIATEKLMLATASS